MKKGIAMWVVASLCIPAGAQAIRHPSAPRVAGQSREHWRREAVGRWVSERGADAFLILSRDGTYQAGFYQGKQPRVDETGTYTISADGSVTVAMARLGGLKMPGGGGGTYQRRGDAIYAAIGPSPWVRWHKERGPHRPLVLAPEPHPIP